MRHKEKKQKSIYTELAGLILTATVIAVIFFFAMMFISEICLDGLIYDSGYVDRRNELYISKFQKYVTDHGLSSEDTEEVMKWIQDQKSADVMLYKDNHILFDSFYPEKSQEELEEFDAYYDIGQYYTIEFADGEIKAAIIEKFEYQYYYISEMIELIIAFAIFFAIVMYGISKRIAYIKLLGRQIEIMGTGLLDQEVTVSGTDEIGNLARQLNEMRIALKANIERERFLENANRRMVTEMSHDLRTPLTSMSLYLDLIKKAKYSGEEQLGEYIEKMEKQINSMQILTEHLFDYALISENDNIILEDPRPAKAIFYDLLSECIAYLSENSFQVMFEGEWGDLSLCVHSGFVARILNNITSNICKYADAGKPVSIRVNCLEGGVKLDFMNYKEEDGQISGMNSTGIGLVNIKNMMHRMKGSCKIKETDNTFEISLIFS